MITVQSNGNPITQNFIDAVQDDSRRFLVQFLIDGAELDCDIDSVSVTKGSCATDTMSVGSVVGSCLTANIRKLSQTIKNKELEYRVGLWVGSDYEWITVGTYKISEVKNTHYTSVITAYSSVISDTNVLLEDTISSTIAELASAVSTQIGRTITFDAGIDTSAYLADSVNGISVYEALQIIAVCSGGYVINDNANNIKVKLYDSTPTLSVNAGMMNTLPVISEEPFEVGSVYCLVRESASDEDTGISYGAKPCILVAYTGGEEKVIVTEANDEIEADMYVQDADVSVSSRFVSTQGFANIKKLIGYTYYPSQIVLTLGDPRIEGDDVLAVTDIDGSVYAVPCHNIIHSYTGGFESTINSVNATDKENSIGTQMPITTQIKQVAKQVADVGAKIQYFWHSDDGAHVTEIPRGDFEADPQSGGGNLLARSSGISVRDGLEELAVFGADGMRIGKSAEKHIEVTDSSFNVYDEDGSAPFAVSTVGSQKTKTLIKSGSVSANSGTYYKFITQLYLRGAIEDNRIYFGVDASGEPTDFDNYIEGDGEITVDGVICTVEKTSSSSVEVTFENTNNTSRYIACKYTETYYETFVKVNDGVLDRGYSRLALVDSTGVSIEGSCYAVTYGKIAMVDIAVYNTSSISVGNVIYAGTLLNYLPELDTNLICRHGSKDVIVGRLYSDGTIQINNTSTASLATTASNNIILHATYIFK